MCLEMIRWNWFGRTSDALLAKGAKDMAKGD